MYCRIVVTRINLGIPGGEVEFWRAISSLVLRDKNRTIGLVAYHRSMFISPTESRLAGQEQGKRRQGQGVLVGLGFRRGLWFGLS